MEGTREATADRATRVLVAEDDRNLARSIVENLRAERCLAEVVPDARTARKRFASGRYDLVILDVTIPEMDRCTICWMAREKREGTPVLLLDVKSAAGYACAPPAGAGDCSVEPIGLEDLLLRVRSILRRRPRFTAIPESGPILRFGGNEFDWRALRGRSWDGEPRSLSERETQVLRALAERRDEVVSREELLDAVWGDEAHPSTRTIEGYILRLRRKFERDPTSPRLFHAIGGVGYRFTPDGEGP